MEEKTLKSRKIYEGRLINLRIDEVSLPDGRTSLREIVEHPGAVAILPLLGVDTLIIVKQYRKSIEQVTLEIPAGTLKPGEDILACAHRELEEETGYKAEHIEKVLSISPSPGYCNETIHIFMASGLKKSTLKPERDEFLQVIPLKLEEALKGIKEGKIIDSKSIVAILWITWLRSNWGR